MKFLSTHFSSQLSSLFNVLASSALTLPPVLGHQWTWRGSIPLHCPALKKTLNNTRPCSEPWGAPPVTSHYCNSDLCPVNFPLILLLSPLVSSSAPRILQEAAKSLLEVQVNNTHCSPVPAEMVMALWHCPFQCPLASLPIVLSPGFVTETMWKDCHWSPGTADTAMRTWLNTNAKRQQQSKFCFEILLQNHHNHREGFDVLVINFPGIFL